jgi:hypothetical protein
MSLGINESAHPGIPTHNPHALNLLNLNFFRNCVEAIGDEEGSQGAIKILF